MKRVYTGYIFKDEFNKLFSWREDGIFKFLKLDEELSPVNTLQNFIDVVSIYADPRDPKNKPTKIKITLETL